MARMIFDDSALASLMLKLTKADMYNEDDIQEFLYAGAEIFVKEAKAAAERAGHHRTGLMIDKIDYYRKIDKRDNGFSVSISVMGKDRRSTPVRNAEKAFVLNYGRGKEYGFIPGSHFWNQAALSAEPKMLTVFEDIFTECLKERGLI